MDSARLGLSIKLMQVCYRLSPLKLSKNILVLTKIYKLLFIVKIIWKAAVIGYCQVLLFGATVLLIVFFFL